MCRCSSGGRGGGGGEALRCAGGKEALKIQAFYIRLAARSAGGEALKKAELLTLVYRPRTGGASLEVNDVQMLPGAAAFVGLHRVRAAESGGDLVFGSTDRVCAGEGILFEVYAGEEERAAVEGSFRRRDGGGWRMKCWVAADGEEAAGIEAADICVAGEDKVVMMESVDAGGDTGGDGEEVEGHCGCCTEEEEQDDGWRLSENTEEDGEDDDWLEEDAWQGEEEGTTWAVDLGIWAACLGVGILVSRASCSKRRQSFLPF
ncbi:unnamed protein product [Spirodela intermedia]|uniref:Uncharacterized protein n=1 Tax=Spirodela intermedia TaxID=51605 RepID=A0A7I8IEY6_SPIIN|nr:unnamed protein product [Spirodela intermedia]CAA6656360.1 unnamed protein product [Spirodela intermedia]